MTVGYCFLIGILILSTVELFLRSVHRISCDSPLPYGIRSEHEGRLSYCKLRKNFKGKSRSGIFYQTNSLGFRDKLEINKSFAHVLFLGDSTTFGLNIDFSDTFSERFEHKLNALGYQVQSINSASPGYGTWDEFEVLRNLLESKKYNIKVAVLGFFQNDFSDNWSFLNSKSSQIKNGFFSMLLKYLYGARAYKYFHALRDSVRQRSVPPSKDPVTTHNRNYEYAMEPGREIEWDMLNFDMIETHRNYLATLDALKEVARICELN
jgi:hypothetical protein